MVQARQLRAEHPDCHYAAALFRYLREMACKYREYATLVFLDDKHRCKVGEPGHPVAAVERGKQVLVSLHKKMAVADHDFTKASVIPSVAMICNIPPDITGSFYSGQVHVGIKDAIFESSSPLRHGTELNYILNSTNDANPILMLYTDGGPDHRLTYISVQLTLIALFLSRDLDMVVAVRTPPYHSWRNPVERIMSILNLALQSVGLMRVNMDHQFEEKMSKCSSMEDVRRQAEVSPGFKDAFVDSIEPVKVLLQSLFGRLELKGERFLCFNSADSVSMDTLWNELLLIDSTLTQGLTKKACVSKHPKLEHFLRTHCQVRHYSFVVKKCGVEECSICKVPRLLKDVFDCLCFLPDPIPSADPNHYQPFSTVYGTESHRPSLASSKAKVHGIPFSPSAQTARTVGEVVRCRECDFPRVIYAARKLSCLEKVQLKSVLSDYWYTCGSTLQDLLLTVEEGSRPNHILNKVYIRANLLCNERIETSYYSSEMFEDLCHLCASDDLVPGQLETYPICKQCQKDTVKQPVQKQKRKFLKADGPASKRRK